MSQYASDDELGLGMGDGEGRDLPDVLPGEENRYEVFMPAVQKLVNALGGYEEVETADGKFENVYRPGDSVLGVLKDLKKLWRKDDTDDERTVARCMAKAGLMQELIAIVKECAARGDWGRKVSLMAFDLIAALTWPIDVAAELREMEDEGSAPSDYTSLLRSQVVYKAHLIQDETLRHLLTVLLPSFAPGAARDEKEQRIISLGLHVIRNMLAIKDLVAEDSATGEKEVLSTLQSSLIIQLDQFTYLELLETLASWSRQTEYNPLNVLVLDIVQLIFRSVKMRDLAMDQKRAPMENLRQLLELETREKKRSSRHKSNASRHSRFGTTIAVRAPTQQIVLHSQSAITADTGTLLDRIKKTRKEPTKLVDDPSANLSPEAIEVLQKFSRNFLDCFNDYFETVLNDIQRERQKVRPADTVRALFIGRFLMEYLLVLRKKALAKAEAEAKQAEGDPDAEKPIVVVDRELPLALVGVMADFDTVRWVVARMRISMDTKPVAFNELQAAVNCFTQTLLVLDAMVHSSEQEDREVGEVLQHKIYYNGDILDSAIALFTMWKPTMRDLVVSFFDCSIHFAYVLLRMLEKYSKSKPNMFVRKKARTKARKSKKDTEGEAPIPEEYGNEEDEEDSGDEMPNYEDKEFEFAKFENRFAHEAVTRWLLAYLARYETLDADQLKRVVNLMHRQVVKAKAEGLYFTVSTLHLFRSVLKDKDSLPKGDGTRDLVTLITYILRKFFKKVEQDPFVIVEALLPKGRGQWKYLSSVYDDLDDDGMGGQGARIREKLAAQELEFIKKNNLTWTQQMGVVVSILVSEGHEAWILAVVGAMEVALAARQEIVLAVDGDRIIAEGDDSDSETAVRKFGGPSKDALEKFAAHRFVPNTEELRTALTRNQHVKLMLKLLDFAKVDEDADELEWVLPATIVPSALENSIGAVNQFLADPPTVDDPKKLLRRARRKRVYSDDEGDEGEHEDRPKYRRARKAAELQVFKSAQFVVDSDDDEAADAAFFAREEELRREMQALAEAQGNTMRRKGTRKRKRKGKGENGEANENGVENGDGEENGDQEDVATPSDGEVPRKRRRSSLPSDLESDAEDLSDIDSDAEAQLLARYLDPDDGASTSAPAAAPRPRTQRIVDSDDE